ncbi:MAG: hypothetical protein M3N54_07110, partial [Acidobacteriota bacterium]|nr:hypothetical protein [Acidobacteriota bacterium]
HWLGVLRKVGTGQTERGAVVFDAPTGHYKLKLTDETSENEVFVDIPLSFVHEQMNDVNSPAPETPPVPENKAVQPRKK